jgi:hypothetical protein
MIKNRRGVDLIIQELHDSTDERGASFSVPLEILRHLEAVRDVHIAVVRPGRIRGNHYHARHGEIITVVYQDDWSLHWDTGAGTAVQDRRFTGRGAVSIVIPLHWSHAIKNDGSIDLWLFNASDLAFDPGNHDAVTRAVALLAARMRPVGQVEAAGLDPEGCFQVLAG